MNKSEMQNSARGQKIRIIDSLWTFVVAVAFMGPLALPLLWRNPRFSRQTKQIATLIVVVFTAVLFWYGWASMKKSWNEFQQLRSMLQGTSEM